MEAYPEPPVPPADVNAPDLPGIENLVQPEPVAPSELLNDDKGTEDKENAAPLDSKLKEVEKE